MAGSRFVTADLHVHTLLGPGEAAKGTKPSPAGVIAAARAASIEIIGIADHNTAANVDATVALAGPDILVVPGIEVSTSDGHVVGLFDPDRTSELKSFADPSNLKLKVIGADGAQRSQRAMAELIGEISERGGIAIAAHIDAPDGLLAKANAAALMDIVTSPGLRALEFTTLKNLTAFSARDSDPVRKQIWTNRRKALGRGAPIARIMSSDAHSVEEVGAAKMGRQLTRLRIDELNFDGVRAALTMFPDARCKVEASLAIHFARVLRAKFRGGFVDGLELEFSPNLNCLIGGRGSGKSTVLEAIQALLDGNAPEGLDDQENQPDYTEVVFVDELGTTRTAARKRHGDTFDVDEAQSSITQDFDELTQNFGAELQADDEDDPKATHAFLSRFADEAEFAALALDLLSRLEENGSLVERTSVATSKLKDLRDERRTLDRKLETATDANIVKVAEYARYVAAETPLLDQLQQAIEAIPLSATASPPDLALLATKYGVDLSKSPAKKLIEGPSGLRELLQKLKEQLAKRQLSSRTELSVLIQPSSDALSRWLAQHKRWEVEIAKRKKTLEAAGLTLQVKELERVRAEIKSTDASIAKYEGWETQYKDAQSERERLLLELRQLRDRRHANRQRRADELVASMNDNQFGTRVSVTWRRASMRRDYAEMLGRLFGLHTPRKERLAEAITPSGLAEVIWMDDTDALGQIGLPREAFFPDPKVTMKLVRTFDAIFELETMDVEDSPRVRVRFRGDPTGPGRSLADISLGQLKSVLLGFILASGESVPMLLDQPEDDLDGPYIAETLVSYLHAVKEQRQLIVATHNANIVMLGDAELTIPLVPVSGKATVKAAGAVDNTATKNEIIRLLEGGRDAFQRRAQRYGIV
jgi:energy-coupling factor transporter ATP-binding protein EcfA2